MQQGKPGSNAISNNPIWFLSVFMGMAFAKNLSYSALQLFVNQGLTILVFFLLAKQLSREDFGALNMCLAILLTVFGILSFGIDQLLQKKIAAGGSASEWLPVALGHYIMTGVAFYLLLLFTVFLLPVQTPALLLLAIGKLAMSLSMPYKQVMAGWEEFRGVFRMSIISNITKASCLLILFTIGSFDLLAICFVFMISDFLELVFSIIFFKKHGSKYFNRTGFAAKYKLLVKEAMPQLGTVMLAAAMARFDWIFIGFFLSSTRLAEYSFAYRVFEISLFPMLVIAPLLLTGFSKNLKAGKTFSGRYIFLYRMEMIVSSFMLLLLNILWEPLAGWISGDKYGTVNNSTIFMLSLVMPLLYYNNFLWSMHFAAGRTKFILRAFAIGFLINLGANFLLVPLWGNEGAAVSYLVSILVQTIIYHTCQKSFGVWSWRMMGLCLVCSMAALAASAWFSNEIISLLTGILVYIILLFATRLLKAADKEQLLHFLQQGRQLKPITNPGVQSAINKSILS